jgi:WD40 repeat protein
LQKQPAARYASALGLADDLARFLAGRPIQARPPSVVDRWSKLARRHRMFVAGVAVIMAVLALGIASTTIMALREAGARRRADRHAVRSLESMHQAGAARGAARREAYRARLAVAIAALGQHNIGEAARQLELAPGEHRGWEWRHLQGRLDQSLAVVTGLPATSPVAFPSAGRRIAVALGRGFRVLNAVSGQPHAAYQSNRPCHHVHAFATHSGVRFVLDQSADDTLSFCITDEAGAALGQITLESVHDRAYGLPMAMSPDGRRLAFQSMPYRTVPLMEIFDIATGRRIARCGKPAKHMLQGVAFSPDGTRLAAARSEDSNVHIFDAETGQSVVVLPGHGAMMRGVAFAPDGRRLASSSDDETIRVWDTETGQALFTLSGHFGGIPCVAFSPDGRQLVSGGSDSTIRLWSAESGAAQMALHGHTGAVNAVAFSADGATIASSAADGTARLWDAMAASDATVLRGHSAYIYPVAFSPDGRWIASGSWDWTIRLWDAASGAVAHVLKGHTNPVGALAFTRDSTGLASWAEDGKIRLWDTASGLERGTLTHHTMPHRDSVYSLVMSADGQRLGAVTPGAIRFWNLATRAELPPVKLPLPSVRVVALSPDGRRLAAGGDDPCVVIVDLASAQPIAELKGFPGRIQSLAFSPDGQQVLTAGLDPTLRLWDAGTGRLVRTFAGHSLEVLATAFHPDGTRIASAGHDRSLLIWDTATGEELVRLPGHSAYVFSLAFSPDGATLVSGSGDATMRLWDAFPVARRLPAAHRSQEAGVPPSVPTIAKTLGIPKTRNISRYSAR